MDLLVFLRNVFILCSFFIPMVGTFSFYRRGNDWQQNPFSDISAQIFSGYDWQHNPSLDISSSLSSGNMWQNQPTWDPPPPFVSESVWQQEPFPNPSVSNSGNEWHQWSPDFSPSTRQSGSSKCHFHSWMPHPYCELCQQLSQDHKCHLYCLCP